MNIRPTAAIILGAGRGKRLENVASLFSKTLLLVNDLPVIGYAARAVEPYVDKIVVVAHPSTATDVYEATVDSLAGDSIETTLTIQKKPQGMADAIRVGLETLNGDHSVVVLAGDNIVLNDCNVKNVLDRVRLIDNNSRNNKLSWTFLELLPNEASRFSVYLELGGGKSKLIEKPKEPPSQICWCGPVAFNSSTEMLRRINTLTPSLRGEYEATDLMNTYLMNGESSHIKLIGEWFDVGTPESLEEARRTVSLLQSNASSS